MLAEKNTHMPHSENSTQDVVGAVPMELLEISDTLNLDKIQSRKEDNSYQECSISESCRNKSHDRQVKKVTNQLNSINTYSAKRDMGNDTTHEEHHAKRFKLMQPPREKMIMDGK